MSRFSELLHSSASLGMKGKEGRNADSTLERRILVSEGDTHGQGRISKEGSRSAMGSVARVVLREGTARNFMTTLPEKRDDEQGNTYQRGVPENKRTQQSISGRRSEQIS